MLFQVGLHVGARRRRRLAALELSRVRKLSLIDNFQAAQSGLSQATIKHNKCHRPLLSLSAVMTNCFVTIFKKALCLVPNVVPHSPPSEHYSTIMEESSSMMMISNVDFEVDHQFQTDSDYAFEPHHQYLHDSSPASFSFPFDELHTPQPCPTTILQPFFSCSSSSPDIISAPTVFASDSFSNQVESMSSSIHEDDSLFDESFTNASSIAAVAVDDVQSFISHDHDYAVDQSVCLIDQTFSNHILFKG